MPFLTPIRTNSNHAQCAQQPANTKPQNENDDINTVANMAHVSPGSALSGARLSCARDIPRRQHIQTNGHWLNVKHAPNHRDPGPSRRAASSTTQACKHTNTNREYHYALRSNKSTSRRGTRNHHATTTNQTNVPTNNTRSLARSLTRQLRIVLRAVPVPTFHRLNRVHSDRIIEACSGDTRSGQTHVGAGDSVSTSAASLLSSGLLSIVR